MSLNCGRFNVPPFWLMESLSAPQTTAARCVYASVAVAAAASSQRPPLALPPDRPSPSRPARTVDVCVIVLRLFCRRRRRRRNNNQISIHVRLVWFWFLGSLHENFRRSSACIFVFLFFILGIFLLVVLAALLVRLCAQRCTWSALTTRNVQFAVYPHSSCPFSCSSHFPPVAPSHF